MSHSKALPLGMWAVMAPMLLFMFHTELMNGDVQQLSAKLAAFILLHVVVIGALSLGGAFLLRKRVHLPSLSHIGLMLAGASASAICVHVFMHSGVV